MSAGWICAACGSHYPGAQAPPASCLICTDERQWVAPSGQRWTTMAELAADGCHCDIWEEEPGLLGVGVNPPVGIGQRGLIVRHAAGNLLWDRRLSGRPRRRAGPRRRRTACGDREPSALLRGDGRMGPGLRRLHPGAGGGRGVGDVA